MKQIVTMLLSTSFQLLLEDDMRYLLMQSPHVSSIFVFYPEGEPSAMHTLLKSSILNTSQNGIFIMSFFSLFSTFIFTTPRDLPLSCNHNIYFDNIILIIIFHNFVQLWQFYTSVLFSARFKKCVLHWRPFLHFIFCLK